MCNLYDGIEWGCLLLTKFPDLQLSKMTLVSSRFAPYQIDYDQISLQVRVTSTFSFSSFGRTVLSALE